MQWNEESHDAYDYDENGPEYHPACSVFVYLVPVLG
jgi:hypothetical protein